MKDQIISRYADGDIAAASDLIRQALAQGVDIHNIRVLAAGILFQAADWKSIANLLPAGTNFMETSGFLNSIRKGRPLNSDNEPIPWFTYPAIDFLDEVVKSQSLVFEWGSGNSSLWWSRRASKVVSVEDNAAWYLEIKSQFPSNGELLLRDSGDYARSILEYPDGGFDVIVIDGSDRNSCALTAPDKLKPQGLIVFDNSDSPEFRTGQKYLMDQGFLRIDFWGPIPSYLYKNCTSVYFKDPAILSFRSPPFDHVSSVGISCFQAMLGPAAAKSGQPA